MMKDSEYIDWQMKQGFDRQVAEGFAEERRKARADYYAHMRADAWRSIKIFGFFLGGAAAFLTIMQLLVK